MNFLRKIKDSVYNPDFYSDLLKNNDKKLALRYFFKLSCFLALIMTIWFLIAFYPKFTSFTSKENIQTLISTYPEKLELVIKKGELSTNLEKEPYFIKGNADLNTSKNKTNFLVIDTKNEITLETFKKYDTLILLSKNTVMSQDNNYKITIQELKNFPDITLNKEKINNWAGVIQPKIKYLLIIFIPLLFIAFFLSQLAHLIYLIFGALIIWGIIKLKSQNIGYKNSYKIGLYAISTASILSVIAFITSTRLPFLFYSLVLAIVVFINVKKQ